MEKYHLRRSDKEIQSKEEILKIIKRQEFFTLAMCKDNQPYLVSLNYGFDTETDSFYFHCAHEGKKLDILRDNPIVYGQILENLKYKEGECSYAYRSVHFKGIVTFIDNLQEKQHALEIMVDKLEDPRLISSTKRKYITSSAIQNVMICKITVDRFTGKQERL